jgi:hypothetical protein
MKLPYILTACLKAKTAILFTSKNIVISQSNILHFVIIKARNQLPKIKGNGMHWSTLQ